ncbi:hypothetical protein VP01_2106g3, partial [Puccinia sorghi]
MTQDLSKNVPHFNKKYHLLGCISHVINLGARAGLSVLGSINDK